MAQDNRRVEELAGQAMAYPVELRAAFLAGACWMDPLLRQRVEARLAAGGGPAAGAGAGSPDATLSDALFADATLSDEPLGDATLADLPATPGVVAPDETAGAVIGRYQLLQVLGEGGFGKVWLAEQKVPVRRHVALKIIKLGMDTQQVVARFEAERQALALMDHPHIAKVLDAGATAKGRPYFVMERVEGLPITTFCDEALMGLRDRLDLFIKVCQAIQHAHQKGIIHRDIKPSNVLVRSSTAVRCRRSSTSESPRQPSRT